MGAGKTAIALSIISDLFEKSEIKNVLVISSLRIVNTTWPEEFKVWEFSKDFEFEIATGSSATRKKAVEKRKQITLINFENVEWLVNGFKTKWPYDCVIVDESTAFKSHRSKRFKALRKILPYTEYITIMTGTPSPNGYMDLWSQIYLLDQGERLGRTITNFRTRYFNPSGYMGYQYEIKPDGKEKIDNAIKDIVMALDPGFKACEVITENIPCVMPPKLQKQYDYLKKEMIFKAKNGDLPVDSAAALSNKLCQFANGAIYTEEGKTIQIHDLKIKALKEIMEDNPSENILLAYNFIFDRNKIINNFPEAVILDDNPETVKKWNKGKIKLLIAHPKSGGHGLNLQFGGSVCIWYGLNYNLELYQQFNARLPRPGQKDVVRIFHLAMENTIDFTILKALQNKAVVQENLFKFLLQNM